MLAFFAVWYFFTITTYGTNVPAGLFLPGMIVGCTLGDIYAAIMSDTGLVDSSQDNWVDIRKKYIVIGCAAFMAGYTRMTYSLGVILMETSQDLSLFVPIIFTIIISNQTGYKFTRSLYQRATRGKQMPIITDRIPAPCKNLKAGDVMAAKPVTLRSCETMENIQDALKTNHHAFPIVNKKGNLIGMIPRNFVIILIKNEAFYATTELPNDINRSRSVHSDIDAMQAQNVTLKAKLIAKNKYINKNEYSAITS